jgi:hypothetical protein
MKISLLISAGLISFGLLSGCSENSPAPIGVYPYPQPTNGPNGPVPPPGGPGTPGTPNGPRGPGRPPLPRAVCAPITASPTRSPLELRTLADGGEGCLRLVSLTHSEGAVVGGVMTSAIVSETRVSYRELHDRRGRYRGLKAVVESKNSCSILRDSPYAYLTATADVPLWISRESGAIGQTLRVKAGNLRSGDRWKVRKAPAGYDLDAFDGELRSNGTWTVGKLADGSVEVYATTTIQEPGEPAPIRRTVRAVYMPDFDLSEGDVEGDSGDVDDGDPKPDAGDVDTNDDDES